MMKTTTIAALLLSSSFAVGADDNAAAPIERLLANLSERVEAEDNLGYLEHVWAADPVFLTEQRNWAVDLLAHPVGTFSLTLDDPGAIETRGDWAFAVVTMTWRLEREDAEERTVSYPARFVSENGRWRYAGERWVTVLDDRHGPANRAMAPEGLEPVALQIAELLPAVREGVDEMFAIENGGEQAVKVYASMEHLQASIYLSYESPLGGWNEPGEAIKLLAGPSLRAGSLRRLLGHEYGHVASFIYGEHANDVPWWILEGVAEQASFRVAGGSARAERSDRRVRRWNEEGDLKDWSQLADFRGEAASFGAYVYAQGASMVGYITDRFGDDGRNAWLRAMCEGAPLGDATHEALGISFDRLDRDWRDSIPAPEDED